MGRCPSSQVKRYEITEVRPDKSITTAMDKQVSRTCTSQARRHRRPHDGLNGEEAIAYVGAARVLRPSRTQLDELDEVFDCHS